MATAVQDRNRFVTGAVGVPGSEGILPSTSDNSSHTVFSVTRCGIEWTVSLSTGIGVGDAKFEGRMPSLRLQVDHVVIMVRRDDFGQV